jgi:hypothetical protein
MKKPRTVATKPLQLQRETIAQLDQRALITVVGGRWNTAYITCTC